MIRWVALEDDGGEISVVSVVDVMVMSWALFGLFFFCEDFRACHLTYSLRYLPALSKLAVFPYTARNIFKVQSFGQVL